MLEVFSPRLLEGTAHPELGALYSNAKAAEIFGCEPGTIRSQKKRLKDQGELVEGKHWITLDTSTFWSFEGACLLGLTLSTELAQKFRLAITEMLKAWNSGELVIVPSESGGIEIQPKTGVLQQATGVATPVATALELPDPVAVGEAIALHRHEAEINAWKGKVATVVEATAKDLSQGIVASLGKHLSDTWGVNPL